MTSTIRNSTFGHRFPQILRNLFDTFSRFWIIHPTWKRIIWHWIHRICTATYSNHFMLSTTSMTTLYWVAKPLIEIVLFGFTTIETAAMRWGDSMELFLKSFWYLTKFFFSKKEQNYHSNPKRWHEPCGSTITKCVGEWRVQFIVNGNSKANCFRS